LKSPAWWLTGSVGLLADALGSLINVADALARLNALMQGPEEKAA
jgi:divalent metal cation (Fe/Co/Zn/Cd) transporter